jgi:hypothetical protein
MKAYSTFIIYIAVLVSTGSAKTEITQEGYFCRQIEMSLAVEFLHEGKPFPRSFDEMQLLREMVARDPETSRSINGMVIVPDIPKISDQNGISYVRSGRRLFAISRKAVAHSENKDELGRYSVWISKNEKDVIPDWMPEAEAQLVLDQLEDFEPESQPMAFVEAEEKIREKKQRIEMIRNETREAYERTEKRSPRLRSNDDSDSDEGESIRVWWFVAGIGLLVFLSWRVFQASKRKNSL